MGTEERVVNSGGSLNWAWRKKSFLGIDDITSLWCFLFVLIRDWKICQGSIY